MIEAAATRRDDTIGKGSCTGRVVAPAPVFAVLILLACIGFAAFASILHRRGVIFDRDDPVCYYVYLRSLVHDGDLDFTNDYDLFRQPDGTLNRNFQRIDPVTGRPDNNYTIGLPLLVAPFYLAGNVLLAPLYGRSAAAGRFPLFIDQLLFSFGALILGCMAMWLSFKFASSYFTERDSLLATVAVWLCSPLIYYFVREPFQSHLAAAFAVSLFLYVWRVPSWPMAQRAVVMGMTGALMAMVRQQDAVVMLIPLGAFLIQNVAEKWSRAVWVSLPLFGIGFLAVYAVQMLAWHSLRGSFFSYAYRGETFAYAMHPQLWQVLFSSNHGLIAWHPLIALCLTGLLLLGRSAGGVGWLALICFATQLYAIASWWCWWMSNSFGHRGFLGLTPLFILGLTAILHRLHRPSLRRIFYVVAAVLFVWNMILMLAYVSEMIPYEGDFSWLALIHSLPQLPSRLLAKMGRV